MRVKNRAGQLVEISFDAIKARITRLYSPPYASADDELPTDVDAVVMSTINGIYDGIATSELDDLSANLCANMQTEHHGFNTLAGKIAMSNLHKKAAWLIHPEGPTHSEDAGSVGYLVPFSAKVEFIHARLPKTYAADVLAFVRRHSADLDAMVDYRRDFGCDYFSVRTMEMGYLLRVTAGAANDGGSGATKAGTGGKATDVCIESPQDMWLRVAIAVHCTRTATGTSESKTGTADGTDDETDVPELLQRIRDTYDHMSRGLYTHATPTLFNAGSGFEQLSSCYLLGIEDSLEGIYSNLKDCAQISKWAGGIGIHISNIRAKNSRISSTNGTSDGIVPMLKVYNETARYCNQSGKRKGSIALYLEPWHADVTDFVELRRPTGVETQRTRDLFLALWVPDLFMRAVMEDREWHLMSPDISPGLQDVYGDAFDALYASYVRDGKFVRCIKARDLWSLVLQCQIETGTPYVLFKDHVNRKCNQKNLGPIRSSNLCAEITEFSDADTYAVCNLASVAVNRFLPKRLSEKDDDRSEWKSRYDFQTLHRVAQEITRNLDRIIDVNYYPTPQTRKSNMQARPIGIGVQGFANLYHDLHLTYGSASALDLDAAIMETIYHGALTASVQLAREKGKYPCFDGSPFSRGELQMDLWRMFPSAVPTPARYSGLWDWEALRADVVRHGTRNSMLTALMPTASTSQILGNNECFEPADGNMFVRKTLAGEFLVVNKALMQDLMALGLWSPETCKRLKDGNGSLEGLQNIIPPHIREVYRTAWDVPQKSIIQHALARAPFVDQSQSMNLFMDPPDYQRLNQALEYGWKTGLKTGMYYLRSQPARLAERCGTGGIESGKMAAKKEKGNEDDGPVCRLDRQDGECLVCSA